MGSAYGEEWPYREALPHSAPLWRLKQVSREASLAYDRRQRDGFDSYALPPRTRAASATELQSRVEFWLESAHFSPHTDPEPIYCGKAELLVPDLQGRREQCQDASC